MAFFNLTKLGVQDPIKAAIKVDESVNDCKQPYAETTRMTFGSSSPHYHHQNQLQASPSSCQNGPKYTSEAQGSYVKFTERLTKHQRTKDDPNEIYSKPVTASQEYGWWRQDGAPKSLPWTKIKKFSRLNSEMTRFVDEMTLTNKHFTLF